MKCVKDIGKPKLEEAYDTVSYSFLRKIILSGTSDKSIEERKNLLKSIQHHIGLVVVYPKTIGKKCRRAFSQTEEDGTMTCSYFVLDGKNADILFTPDVLDLLKMATSDSTDETVDNDDDDELFEQEAIIATEGNASGVASSSRNAGGTVELMEGVD
jgi:hypothetical protein